MFEVQPIVDLREAQWIEEVEKIAKPFSKSATRKERDMLPDRKRLFHIVSAEGEHYFVTAESFGEAVDRFKKWERGDDPGEFEDPQSVHDAGWLIVERG